MFDSSRPNVARVYDYLLGGKDNFAADRTVGDQIMASLPAVGMGVRAQRDVLGRVVRYLVADVGIGQLLDIGSGLPTAENVHEIAQHIEPATRVVYIDNDPVVLTHAEALLADQKATFAVAGDLTDPAAILADPEVRGKLDWDKPIGLLLCGILHFLLDEDDPVGRVATLVEALPSGSYVFIHHLLSGDSDSARVLQEEMQRGLGRVQFRTLDRVMGFFDGLDLVDPGLVHVADWRPAALGSSALGSAALGAPAGDHPVLRLACAGVARKP